MFQTLFKIISEVAGKWALNINVILKGENLTISVMPITTEDVDDNAFVPFVMTGTPDEIEQNFENQLRSAFKGLSELHAEAEDYNAKAKEELKESKKEVKKPAITKKEEKKVEEKKKADKIMPAMDFDAQGPETTNDDPNDPDDPDEDKEEPPFDPAEEVKIAKGKQETKPVKETKAPAKEEKLTTLKESPKEDKSELSTLPDTEW